ncbi:hypothetical protein E3N88_24966 [Mikania micrantha]|uniref:Growth-regulating factor n=1 Tax=Mikania micrantha TaxID=192012 RepID=A0A5N6N6A3_9ASTR|nr:hypothetical protein E3N88_24966 [Mikania micrantha]
MWSSDEYNTGGDGCRNEKPEKATPSHAADVSLALNMQYPETTYPSKNINFISDPSLYHHPQHRASIDFGGGNGGGHRLLFGNSTATSNQIASGTSFVNSTGEEMQKMVFTASQLQEFENQTMIYRHIMSSNPIPPQLLLPLSTQYNNSEPWRCRRTDGKKWRCSRDVMPDQKYCERHAHKNRPRSRKPVETQSQNTKILNDEDNYHSVLHPASSVPTSCQQSRCTEWFMRGGNIPLSSSHQKVQKPILSSSSVGSKKDHFFENLDGSYQDLVEGHSCSLTLMQPGGDLDQDYFQMGTGTSNADGSNPQVQLAHQGSWLGGPLGEALCPGVVSSLDQPASVSSPNDPSHGLR